MSLGKTRRAAALTLAISTLALLGVAQAATAATVSVDQPCYVERDGKGALDIDPFTIGVSSSGLPVGKYILFELLGGQYWTNHYLEEVPANGAVSFPWEGWITESDGPVAEQHTLKVVGISGSPVYAETTVWMAKFGMAVSDTDTEDSEKVTFQFAGLAPERPIYAHYVAHGKEIFSHKMGIASGPCGALEVKSQFYPAKHSHYNSYLLQFDQRKKYSPKTKPSFRHGLETGKF